MLSSHLLFEVERICNKVAIMNKGRLLYQGSIQNLLRNGRVAVKISAEPMEQAYGILSCDSTLSVSRNGSKSLYIRPDGDVPRVNAMLVVNEISVSEIVSQRATLEEIFLT